MSTQGVVKVARYSQNLHDVFRDSNEYQQRSQLYICNEQSRAYNLCSYASKTEETRLEVSKYTKQSLINSVNSVFSCFTGHQGKQHHHVGGPGASMRGEKNDPHTLLYFFVLKEAMRLCL